MVGVAWIGFDQPKTLGANETGGVAALPIWIAYMEKALKGMPEKPLPTPDGVIAVRINAETGLARRQQQPDRILLRRVSAARPRRQRWRRRRAAAPRRTVRDQLF